MIVYLATHYSHQDAAVRQARFEAANRVAAWAMAQGHVVFSPISHSHHIADHLPDELMLDHEFWMAQDLPILRRCDAVWVFPADAAVASRGVAREVLEAEALDIPVRYVGVGEVE